MQLEEAYKLYVNDLYRYLFSLSRDHYIAEDLVQDAFYRAYVSLDDYEISNIKAWLFKVAYHAFVDYQRKNKRVIFEDGVLDHLDANLETPERMMVEKEAFKLLIKDVNSLQENEKHAILLCDLHDLPYQEAAEILELKLNTFKSHLSRGRKKLMEVVKERMNKDGG
ncbi:RNA polymerase subunit sigma [Bacillus sp. M6-12]|uniref:sigma-70 family RNA polymerase sigma factor n=1 Tax=Bacillus sp. M6-12 TaxID=2054166 RepID=UPI000C75B214|nr:sigma-70 family RNA polymerase sigma factor [Bacillus sp. M6-12]PLS17437.1 RNA polymerase subunit sigma [Bacillus sp. M6-12]